MAIDMFLSVTFYCLLMCLTPMNSILATSSSDKSGKGDEEKVCVITPLTANSISVEIADFPIVFCILKDSCDATHMSYEQSVVM